ncbi:MAG: hypothetical protein ABL868_07050 [Sulfuriferula sp.]
MVNVKSGWGAVVFWGVFSGLCYALLFHYADALIRLAQTTVDTCAVVEGGKTIYYSKPDAAECAVKGGQMIAGNGWYIFAPIMVALIISYAHGAFTGQFWEAIGLTAAKKK